MYEDEDEDALIPSSYTQKVLLEEPATTHNDVEEEQKTNNIEGKPKIILLGLRRSGKSSIRNVVFHKMSANETLYLESTTKLVCEDVSNNCFIDYVIHDFPGQVDPFEDSVMDIGPIFEGRAAVIFVIDALEDYKDAVDKLIHTVVSLHNRKENLENLEIFVFIHKVDGLSADQRRETLKDITARANDELLEAGISKYLNTQLTSVFNHSILDAVSKVSQKLIPELLSTFESLLNALKEPCSMDRVFLFDVATKCYIATDTEIVNLNIYETCCDMIDLVIDVSLIYNKQDSPLTSPYDKKSFSCVQLENGTVILMRYITHHLTLVCLLQESCLSQLGLIEYNIAKFSQGMDEVLAAHAHKKYN